MIPASYSLTGNQSIYQGDPYGAHNAPLFTLPDLSSIGGPSSFVGSANVTAQIKDASGTLVGTFTVVEVDAAARQVRPTMNAAQTAALPITTVASPLFWDIQINDTGGPWTILKGKVKVLGQVTR